MTPPFCDKDRKVSFVTLYYLVQLQCHDLLFTNIYNENYACCRAYTLPARSNKPRCGLFYSDSVHFACPGMQNGAMLEVSEAILISAKENRYVQVNTTFERPEAMPQRD